MTPQQAAEGLIELVAEDSRVLVDFRDSAAGDPDIEAEVIRAMLDAGESDGDICGAVQKYVDASGLAASFFLGGDEVIVTIGSHARGPRIGGADHPPSNRPADAAASNLQRVGR